MNDVVSPALWESIANDAATDGLVLRRVLPKLEHNIFVGEKRPSRQRLLLLEVIGSHENLPTRRPSSQGLDVRVQADATEKVTVRLVSTSALGDPLFEELVNDIVRALDRDPGAGAAVRVIERVVAWQAFFARRSDPLSKEQAAGLFSELSILHLLAIPTLGCSDALMAWTGPDPAIQDFQHQDTAVEVKSYRGSGTGKLSISSERQLETTGLSRLFLAYVELDERQDGVGSSLLELVDKLRGVVASTPSAAYLLEGKLLSYPWHDSFAEFRQERYEIRRLEFFEVLDGFPRLVSADLPNGVGAVSYVVDRSALDGFKVAHERMAVSLKGEL